MSFTVTECCYTMAEGILRLGVRRSHLKLGSNGRANLVAAWLELGAIFFLFYDFCAPSGQATVCYSLMLLKGHTSRDLLLDALHGPYYTSLIHLTSSLPGLLCASNISGHCQTFTKLTPTPPSGFYSNVFSQNLFLVILPKIAIPTPHTWFLKFFFSVPISPSHVDLYLFGYR